jgi:hypothetical protein
MFGAIAGDIIGGPAELFHELPEQVTAQANRYLNPELRKQVARFYAAAKIY